MVQIHKQKLTRWYFYLFLVKSNEQKVYFAYCSFFYTFFLAVLNHTYEELTYAYNCLKDIFTLIIKK